MPPARPTWSSSPHPPAEGSAASSATTALLSLPRDIWTLCEAGLTSKAHRDRSTKSRLTWAVSPAPGIGLPAVRATAVSSGATGATTDPGGCHARTLTRYPPLVRWRSPSDPPPLPARPPPSAYSQLTGRERQCRSRSRSWPPLGARTSSPPGGIPLQAGVRSHSPAPGRARRIIGRSRRTGRRGQPSRSGNRPAAGGSIPRSARRTRAPAIRARAPGRCTRRA